MGRRKKEPKSTHREKIASAAQVLFMQKGMEATSMDEIARESGYSKATLYVYFHNKEEIISLLVLESMKKLYTYIASALESQRNTRARYDLICEALVNYQEEFPFYFKTVLKGISIDLDRESCLPEEKETFRIGEEINEKLRQFLVAGIASGDLRRDILILPTIFTFWAMLSGLIQTATNKEAYILQEMKLSKQDFLAYGFAVLYRSIAKADYDITEQTAMEGR